MNHVGINAAIAQPTGQPKAVAPGLVRDGNSGDFLPGLDRASSRQRYKSRNSTSGSAAIFFSGSRLMPGIIPATSQFRRLISIMV
jgi:hypothetical protein